MSSLSAMCRIKVFYFSSNYGPCENQTGLLKSKVKTRILVFIQYGREKRLLRLIERFKGNKILIRLESESKKAYVSEMVFLWRIL